MIFTINRELINFIIVDKIIYYSDRKLKSFVRCLPRPDKLLETQKSLSKIFEFTEEELKEYGTCISEADVAKSVLRDASLKGCRLIIKKESETTDQIRDLIKDKEVIVLGELV